MGNLAEQNRLVKGICVGHSGSGKTAALASIAAAGYNLVIEDFDNGTQILMDPSVLDPKYRNNIWVVKFQDKMKATPGAVIFEPPQAYSRMCRFNATGKFRDVEVPPLHKMDESWVVCIDSGTFMGDACLRQALQMASRLNDRPRPADWGKAQEMQENVLGLLYGDATPCHVIVNFHIKQVADPDEKQELKRSGEGDKEMIYDLTPQIAMPYALGKALPPKVGRYFNFQVLVEQPATGGERRVMRTKFSSTINIKTAIPSKLKAEYPIAEGWAAILEAMKGD